ncbi:hypothetical protein BDV93DRAFT_608066 [Ceratobasidium sp. AG-I]|nr:hypothetical protein BDV93DRAFT_608066 [Ceratobasidium sp. AG-I]
MPDKYKLLHSPQSPYVRKVVIAARILGLHDQIERVTIKTSEVTPPAELISVNPLGKIPAITVISDDPSRNGQSVFDSSVILQYFDSIAEHRDTLYPPSSDPARITALNYEALADGVLDAAYLFRVEALKPEPLHSEQASNGQLNKIRRGIQALAKLPKPEFPSVQAVALAVALWYVSRRVPNFRWQEVEGGKELEEWFKRAAAYKAWAEEGEVPPS